MNDEKPDLRSPSLIFFSAREKLSFPEGCCIREIRPQICLHSLTQE